MATGKLRSDNFESVLTPGILRVGELLTENGRDEVRLVGGAVRDLLLDRKPHDVDLATTMLPSDMMMVFEKAGLRVVPTGLQHGTVTVVVDKQNVEVTTLRVDQQTDGRHAKVEFTRDWRVDAGRRDLTMNAMSLAFDGTLFDYFNGKEDLANRRVLFVGEPRQRIAEDYLRILRYFRFHGRIAKEPNEHDAHTREVLKSMAHGLRKISVERIWMEMSALLRGRNARGELEVMYDIGVAEVIGLPHRGSVDLGEFETVWVRQERAAAFCPPVLLAALIPDTGEVSSLCELWKMSNDERLMAQFVSKEKAHVRELSEYKSMLTDGGAKPDILPRISALLVYQGRAAMADSLRSWNIPKFPVSGNALKARGLKGKQLGDCIKQLRLQWQESDFTLSADELLANFDQTQKP